MMYRRRSNRRRTASLLTWSMVLTGAVFAYLTQRPIQLGSSDDLVEGAPILGAASSDFLVVISPEEIVRSSINGRFQEVNWSWAWIDMLEGEIGPVRVVVPNELRAEDLDGARVVVVTHSAVAHPGVHDQLHRMEQFVNAGGLLVLERPQGTLRDAFSADGRGGQRTPRAITHVTGVADEIAGVLQEIPLFTRYLGSTGPLIGSETLMSMDGAPVVYRLERAAGWVITVDFNLGLTLVSLQQGRPDGDRFEISASNRELGPTVDDLVAIDAMRNAEFPVADVLEHFIVDVVIANAMPVAAIWPYPEGADGVVLLSHDTGGNGSNAVWMAADESRLDISSTFFFGYSAGPTDAAMPEWRQTEASLGVLWDRGDSGVGNRRFLGVGALRPFYRIANLAQHSQRLTRQLGDGANVRGVRIRNGLWTDGYAEAFEAMSAAGFVYDSSYGQWTGDNGVAPGGFSFGTGRPFLVYDHNGLPLGMYEVPTLFPSLSEPAELEEFQALLRSSHHDTHQALGVQVTGDLLAGEGGLAEYDAWQDLGAMASRQNHGVMNLDRLIAFRRARASSGLRSRLVEHADSEAYAGHGLSFVIHVDAAAEDMWVRVPVEIGERVFDVAGLRVDGEDTEPEVRNVEMYGLTQLLVEVPEGESRLEVVYQ